MRTRYRVLKHLGNGGYAEVKLVFSMDDNQKYALKKILAGRTEKQKLINETNILTQLSHPNIVKLFKVFDCPSAFYMVLEFMPDGDLHDHITKVKVLSDQEAKLVFYQVFSAVHYLHHNNISHRDLKPANVLLHKRKLVGGGDGWVAKVSDFGLAKVIDSCTDLRTTCGTLMFAAPEVLTSHDSTSYSPKVDVWSLGIMLFICLSGELPFLNIPGRSVWKQIVNGDIVRSSKWNNISKIASQLVSSMTVVQPSERPDMLSAIIHPWFMDGKMKAVYHELIGNEKHRCRSRENDGEELFKS